MLNKNLKAQRSFSLGVPADVTSIAIKNSCKNLNNTSETDVAVLHCSTVFFKEQLSHLKVNSSTFVSIKCPEDVLAELVGVPGGEEHLVHLAEGVRSQLSIGTVLQHYYSALSVGITLYVNIKFLKKNAETAFY